MTEAEIERIYEETWSRHVKEGRKEKFLYALARAIEKASRRAALEEAIQIIETHKVPVGNGAAGEMAAGWTMDALREVRDAIRALAGTET